MGWEAAEGASWGLGGMAVVGVTEEKKDGVEEEVGETEG